MTTPVADPIGQLASAVCDASDIGTVAIGQDGTIVLWNAWMIAASRIPRATALGATIPDLFPELAGSRVCQAIDDALQRGMSATLSQTLHNAPFPLYHASTAHDNETRMQQMVHIQPITYPGAPRHCLVQIVDVTDTTRREHLLRAQARTMQKLATDYQMSAMRTNAILDSAMDGILTINDQGMVETYNPAAERIFGYTPDEVIGQNVKMLMPEPYQGVHDSYINTYLHTGNAKIIGGGREVTGKRQDGTCFPMDLAISEMQMAEQRMFVGVVRDITARRQAERARDESEQRYRLLLNATPEPIVVYDMEGYATYVNPAFVSTFGWAEKAVLGTRIDFVPEDQKRATHEVVRRILSGEQVCGFETRRRTKDGMILDFQLTASLFYDRQGDPLGSIVLFQDITERKKVDRLKNEFVSTVSHELRTPLTSIRGSLGLIAGGAMGEVPDKIQSLVEIAYNNSERLVLLINDILDMEKIASGKMDFHMQPSDVTTLVQEALEANRAYGEQYGITFALTQTEPGVAVEADHARLMQVLTNLLSNAAKFSPPNTTVEIGVSRQDDIVRITITDYGPGIPEEFRSRIFQKFAQADASDTRQKGGTGLGLSICKAIVEHHGGRIGFATARNKGTTFYFELPAWQNTILPREAGRFPSSRILICDDDAASANVLHTVLSQHGFDVDIAVDTALARQLLEQHQYAAMTLDLALPDQNGIAFIRDVRAVDRTRHLPIVAVSATAEEGRNELNGDAFAIVDWLQKPIEHTQLLAAIQLAAERVHTTRPRILHVENDPDVPRVVAAMLGDRVEIVCAASLQQAKDYLGQATFDLIILDLGLPDGSGLDLLPMLHEQTPPPAVLIFSAHETAPNITQQVAKALTKSRTSNEQLLTTIISLIQPAAVERHHDATSPHPHSHGRRRR